MSKIIVFKTKLGKKFFVINFAILAMLLFFLIAKWFFEIEQSIFIIGLAFCTGAFLYVFTSFLFLKLIIKGNFLIVYWFFNLYEVDIKTITTIEIGKTMWVGFHKHGTSTKGLTISSKFKNDLYITPQNEETFLHNLIEINPNIICKKY